MTGSHYRNLFAYNRWAWLRVLPSMARLDTTDYVAERPFFWGSLHGLLVHAMAAESVWLSRLQGESPSSLLDPAAFADLNDLQSFWAELTDRFQAYLNDLADEELMSSITYRNTRGETYTLRQADILHHVLNHATEHRSQMTPVLHQLGVPTEALDYSLYCTLLAAK